MVQNVNIYAVTCRKRLKSIVTVLLLVIFSNVGFAQSSIRDYTFSTGVDNSAWLTPGSTSTLLSYYDDGASSVTSLGFTFPFEGRNYTQFSVNSNGTVRLGSTACSGSYYSTPFSSSYANYNYPKIVGIGADLYCTSFTYGVTGSYPNRVGVCTYTGYRFSYSSNPFQFQVQLHETTGEIKIVYNYMTSTAPYSIQIGIEGNVTSDVITVNPTNHTPTVGTSSTTYSTWPGQYRYYSWCMESCPRINNLQITSNSPFSAIATWQTNTVTPPNHVIVSCTNASTGTTTRATTVNSYYVFSGLSTGTTYRIGVTPVCSGNDTGYMVQDTLRTGNCLSQPLQIGNGNGTSVITPVETDAYYSLCQQIIDSAELGGANTFSEIAFQYASSTALTVKTNCSIYMGETQQSTYSSSSTSFINDSNFTLVYSGPINCTSGWNVIALTTPFAYSGHGNLVVEIEDQSGVDVANATFYTHTTTGYKSACYGGYSPTVILRNMPATAYTYRSNIKLLYCDSAANCAPPSPVITNITDTRMDIAWAPGYNETAWLVEYSTAPNGPWQGTTRTTNRSYSFTNLNSSTPYYIRVGAICTNDTLYTTVFDTTECGAVYTYPFTESFESYTASSATNSTIGLCWERGTNYYSSYSSMIYPYVQQGTASAGNKSMYFYGYYYTPIYSYLATPRMSLPLNRLLVTFDGLNNYSSSYSCSIIVGTMTDNTDYSTFNPIDTVKLNYGSWKSASVSFQNYNGNDRYIAFTTLTASNSQYYYDYFNLDNIVIDTIPNCAKPINAQITNVVSNSAVVTWDTSGISICSSRNFVLQYKQRSQSTWTTIRTNSRLVFLQNLVANTTYDVRLYTVCNCNDSSAYETLSFKTAQCLTGGDVIFNQLFSTTYYLPVCNNTTSSNHSYTQQIYEVSEMGGPRRIDSVAFHYNGATPLTQKTNCKIYLGHTSLSQFTTSSDYVATSDLIEVYSGNLNCSAGWNTFALSTPFHYNGVDNLVIAVYDSSGATGGTNALFFTGSAVKKALYFASASTINPASPSGNSSGVMDQRCDIKFLSPCNNGISCVPPNVRVMDVDGSSVDLIWVAGGNESSWVIDYRPLGDSVWRNSGVTSDTNYTVNNLSAMLSYEIRVGSICSPDTSYRIVYIRTGCGTISVLPYTEDFERYYGATSYFAYSPNNQLPDCWTIRNSGSNSHANGDNYYPRVYGGGTSTYLPNNSGKSLLLGSNNYYYGNYSSYGAATVGKSKYAILPLIADSLPRLTVSFKYKMNYNASSSDYGTLFFGYVTNDTTFTTIETYRATTSAQSVFIDLAEVQGIHHVPGARLAFRWTQNYMYTSSVYYCALDDIIIANSSACMKPLNLRDVSIDSTTTRLNWTDGTYLTQTQSFEVVWGQYGFDPDTVTVNDTIISDSTLLLTNLQVNTVYQYYVRAYCIDSDTSKWSNAHTFRTAQNPASMPYNCSFELTSPSNNGWTVINPTYGNNAWVFDTITASTGRRSMFISNSAGLANDYSNLIPTVSWAYRDVYIPQNNGNDYNLKFDWKCDGETSNDYLDVYFGGIASVSASDNGVLVAPANSTHVGSYCGRGSSFQRVTYPIPPMSDTIVRIYFAWVNDNNGMGNNPPAAIDNVALKLNCPEPYNITVSNVTTNSANVRWRATVGAYTWVVDYRQAGNPQWTTFYVNDTACRLSNLLPSSTYQVRVRAMCTSVDTSDHSDTVRFSTICGTVQSFPYYESFDNYGVASSSYPTCWTYANPQGVSTRPHCSSITYTTAPASLYFHVPANEATIAVSPRMKVFNPYELEVSFRVFSPNTSSYMVVGLMTDSLSYSSFVALDTVYITRANSWTNHACDLSSYTGNGQFVGFKVGASFGDTIFMDNVKIDYHGADCSDPTGLSHTATTNTARCYWNEVGNYEFTYRKIGDTVWEPTSIVRNIDSNDISGLIDSTFYEWRIRSICANNAGYSHWIYDTILTYALPCNNITNLSYSDVTDESITLSWTADSNQRAWEIHYYDLEEGIDTTVIVTTNPCQLTGLITGLTYYFSVRSLCTSGLMAGWSDTVSENISYCKPVKNMQITPVGPNSVKVTWTVIDPEQYEWELEYGPHGFYEGDGTGTSVTVTGNAEYTLTRLDIRACYDVFVRAKCGNGYYSIWTPRQMIQLAVGIDDPENQDNSVYVYPNPATNEVSVIMNDLIGNCEVRLLDMTGRTINTQRQNNTNAHSVVKLDVKNLARGTYFVKVTNDEKTSIQKLILQ